MAASEPHEPNGSEASGADPRQRTGPAGVGFGPLDGLRALTELQRQGIAAATEVAERFTAMLDGFRRPGPLLADTASFDESSNHNGATDADAMGELRSNVARAFDLYSRVFQTTFESWADLVEARMRDRGISLGATDGADAIALGPPKGVARGELWIHNHSDEEVGPLQLIATPGFSATGQSLSPAAFELAPCTITVPASTSSKIEVTVDLAQQLQDDVFHALVLVNGLPDQALPLRVIVLTDPSATDHTSSDPS